MTPARAPCSNSDTTSPSGLIKEQQPASVEPASIIDMHHLSDVLEEQQHRL